MSDQGIVAKLAAAIEARSIVRLGYSRVRDGLLTLHFVAPVDIRPGETARTAAVNYLWAYCFDEGQLEMHLVSRIKTVVPTEERFEPAEIKRLWPVERWPIPDAWVVGRAWEM